MANLLRTLCQVSSPLRVLFATRRTALCLGLSLSPSISFVACLQFCPSPSIQYTAIFFYDVNNNPVNSPTTIQFSMGPMKPNFRSAISSRFPSTSMTLPSELSSIPSSEPVARAYLCSRFKKSPQNRGYIFRR